MSPNTLPNAPVCTYVLYTIPETLPPLVIYVTGRKLELPFDAHNGIHAMLMVCCAAAYKRYPMTSFTELVPADVSSL